jgi:hypothetical protein
MTPTRPPTHTIGLISLAILTLACLTVTAEQRQGRSEADGRMSGTYQLEAARGDNPQRVAEAATRAVPPGRRDRAYQRLLERLDPPQWLSLDREGRAVTIGSSRGPRAAFDADGRAQQERGTNGRMMATRADLDGDRLRVTRTGGSRGSDFTVTFESLNHGSALRVTRRLDDEDLRRPVTIESYYRRTMDTPRWDLYDARRDDSRDDGARSGFGTINNYDAVPDGVRLAATLDTPLSMRTSRTEERFTMTVRSPAEFRGARIDGTVSRVDVRRGTGDGRDLQLDFRAIELRGRSSDFDARLNTIRLSDGSVLRVNPDGVVGDDDGGGTAVRNGAIGAAVGAVIGAVAAGGRGAVIGAVVGGAGGVILSQDHDDLELPRGTEVTLTAVRSRRQF